jgi:hypothetical protein
MFGRSGSWCGRSSFKGRRDVAQQGQIRSMRWRRPFCCGLPGAIRSGAIPALITRNGLARLELGISETGARGWNLRGVFPKMPPSLKHDNAVIEVHGER